MKTKLWLEKEDPAWIQLVRWNAAREKLFDGPTYSEEDKIYGIAKSCPLVEEAQWFLRILGDVHQLDSAILRTNLRIAGKTDLHARTYLAIHERNSVALKECAELGDATAPRSTSFAITSNL
jgi:hypothetical protein